MAYPPAIIATSIHGDPEIGPEITTTVTKNSTMKRRALIGWTHQDDTTDGLLNGKIWCWVSENPEKLQIFDTTFNRSETPGEVRFCGVANFTMVRMFHPYWCPQGRIPKDMNSGDKKRCRYNYSQLIRRWRILNGMDVDTDPSNPIQPGDPYGLRHKERPARGDRGGEITRGGRRGPRNRRRNISPLFMDQEENLGGSDLDNPFNVSDESADSESDHERLPRLVKRTAPRATHVVNDDDLMDYLATYDAEVKVEGTAATEDSIKEQYTQEQTESTPALKIETQSSSERTASTNPTHGNVIIIDDEDDGEGEGEEDDEAEVTTKPEVKTDSEWDWPPFVDLTMGEEQTAIVIDD